MLAEAHLGVSTDISGQARSWTWRALGGHMRVHVGTTVVRTTRHHRGFTPEREAQGSRCGRPPVPATALAMRST